MFVFLLVFCTAGFHRKETKVTKNSLSPQTRWPAARTVQIFVSLLTFCNDFCAADDQRFAPERIRRAARHNVRVLAGLLYRRISYRKETKVTKNSLSPQTRWP